MLTIRNSEIDRNKGFEGGGIYVSAGSLALEDTDVWANQANRGGGIWIGGSTTTVSCVGNSAFGFVSNHAFPGGGAYLDDGTLINVVL